MNPKYSPNGRRIAFISDRSGGNEVWVCASDGSDPVRLTFFNGPLLGSPNWRPDGRQIAFTVSVGHARVVYIGRLDTSPPRKLAMGPGLAERPGWSRDGRFIYYGSDQSGEWQVWKAPSEGGPASQVTREGGFEGAESPDGKLLYFTKDIQHPGLWRMPLPRGPATKVLEDVLSGAWAMNERGIYFAGASVWPSAIHFLDFVTGRQWPVLGPGRPIVAYGPNLTISPDGRSLLFAQDDRNQTNIMLVENFR